MLFMLKPVRKFIFKEDTVCPRSVDPCHKVTYYMKWV